MNSNTIKLKKKKTKMIAHRGLSGLERENSIRAFTAACNRSYYGSECDIHFTLDKVLVICHDYNTARVSNYDMVISDTNYNQLEKVRLKEFNSEEDGKDLYIPTLIDCLKLHKKYNKKVIVEIKCEMSLEDVKGLLELIKPYYSNIIFISFILDNLKKIRSLDNKIPMQYLCSKFDDSLISICKENNLGIDILYKELNSKIIEDFHNENIMVNAWTVNDKKIAEELIELGIDFITTNILE